MTPATSALTKISAGQGKNKSVGYGCYVIYRGTVYLSTHWLYYPDYIFKDKFMFHQIIRTQGKVNQNSLNNILV